MTGWLVNDRLTAIPGVATFWNHLLDGIPGLENRCLGQYQGLAEIVEREAAIDKPDYIIRNAAYFRWLNVTCPVVSFVQDIVEGGLRDELIDACAASRLVVFNSEYTRMMYPELHAADYRVIPIGTDTSVFRPCEPDPHIPENAILWVGSGHSVKGFDLACRLASESKRPWVFVMKDDTPVEVGALVLRRIDQPQLARIASACAAGVCTSARETQHLAGIEMGLCGLPLVTTNVGAYHERIQGAWGKRHGADWHHDIELVASLPREGAANYWTVCGFGLDKCMEEWRETVRSLEASYVHG